MSELQNKELQELENLYEKAIERGDEILADLICYIIADKQKSIVNSLS